jgi:hypothetical protein
MHTSNFIGHHNLQYFSFEVRNILFEGSEVPIEVSTKSIITWDVTPFSPLKVYRRFGRKYPLHFLGRRIKEAIHQRESRW